MLATGAPTGAARHAPPRDWLHGDDAVRCYQLHGTCYMLGIYGALALFMAGVITWWALVVLLAFCYPRGALLTHELMHTRRPEQVHALLRWMMLFDTPFGLGFREYQNIHMRHHRHALSERDPELFQISGPPWRALLAAFASSELSLLHWLRNQKASRSLIREGLLRACFFGALLMAAPRRFLVYWLLIRIVVGTGNFVFHHLPHYRSGELGTYPLRPRALIDLMIRWWLSPTLANILREHDAHHYWAQVRADRLPDLRAEDPVNP